jgi:hypothetical protein
LGIKRAVVVETFKDAKHVEIKVAVFERAFGSSHRVTKHALNITILHILPKILNDPLPKINTYNNANIIEKIK